MSILDLIIVLILISGAVLGFLRGFTKSLVKAVGFILAVIFAFLLKNGLASFFYENLPFFNFDGIFKGMTVLNIALYELIAFLILLCLFLVVLKVLLIVTSLLEKILTITIVLGIPSKILGMIVGVVEHYIIVFIGLYILSLPMINLDITNNSKLKDPILNGTPLLNGFAKTTVDVMDEFILLKDKYEASTSSDEFNLETLDLFLKYKVVNINSVNKLIEKEKIKTNNIEKLNEILNKYKENNNDNISNQ